MAGAHKDASTAIDEEAWPGVATVPTGLSVRLRARLAEARFAQACAEAGLDLEPDSPTCDAVVESDRLFARLATSGWLGLAESYLAAEWRADDLAGVLRALLEQDFRPPRAVRLPKVASYTGGELPADLIRHSSGDGVSLFAGRFDSGVATTVRTAVRSHVPHAGHRGEPAEHLVDVTTLTEPLHVEQSDLAAAQRRSAESLLDIAGVHPGSHLLEYPTSGGAVLLAAADRRATMDACGFDEAYLAATAEYLTLSGAADAVRFIPVVRPGDPGLKGRYDALVAVEKLEQIAPRERTAYVRGLSRLLAPGGELAMQVVVRTERCNAAAVQALDALRAYIWPGLDYPSITDLHRLCDRATDLRIISQLHLGKHYATSLRFQEETFQAHYREAAAAGIDAVYRRLWRYQFALRRALSEAGMIDAVQLGARHRRRQGRR